MSLLANHAFQFMKVPISILALAISAIAAWAQAPSAALTGERAFETPAANTAQDRYVIALEQAREAFAAGLEPALKAAMAGGSLDEANAIN